VGVFVSTHALSGVLIGHAMRRHPVSAFASGVASHLVLDSMPHWGCDTKVPGGQERFLRAARIDGVLGLAVMATAAGCVDRPVRSATVAAMVGAVLLDIDKPVGHFFGFYPFPQVVKRSHAWAQNESPDGLQKEFGYGIALAVADAVVTATTRTRGTGSEATGTAV